MKKKNMKIGNIFSTAVLATTIGAFSMGAIPSSAGQPEPTTTKEQLIEHIIANPNEYRSPLALEMINGDDAHPGLRAIPRFSYDNPSDFTDKWTADQVWVPNPGCGCEMNVIAYSEAGDLARADKLIRERPMTTTVWACENGVDKNDRTLIINGKMYGEGADYAGQFEAAMHVVQDPAYTDFVPFLAPDMMQLSFGPAKDQNGNVIWKDVEGELKNHYVRVFNVCPSDESRAALDERVYNADNIGISHEGNISASYAVHPGLFGDQAKLNREIREDITHTVFAQGGECNILTVNAVGQNDLGLDQYLMDMYHVQPDAAGESCRGEAVYVMSAFFDPAGLVQNDQGVWERKATLEYLPELGGLNYGGKIGFGGVVRPETLDGQPQADAYQLRNWISAVDNSGYNSFDADPWEIIAQIANNQNNELEPRVGSVRDNFCPPTNTLAKAESARVR